MEKEYETNENGTTITLLNGKRNELETLTDDYYQLMKKYHTEILNMNTLLKTQSLPDFEGIRNLTSVMEDWKSGAAFYKKMTDSIEHKLYKNKIDPIKIEGLSDEITNMEDAQRDLVDGYLKLDVLINSQKKELNSILNDFIPNLTSSFEDIQKLHFELEKIKEKTTEQKDAYVLKKLQDYKKEVLESIYKKEEEIQELSNERYKRILMISDIILKLKDELDIVKKSTDENPISEQLERYEETVSMSINYFMSTFNILQKIKNEQSLLNDKLKIKNKYDYKFKKLKKIVEKLNTDKHVFGNKVLNINTQLESQKEELNNISENLIPKIYDRFEELKVLHKHLEELKVITKEYIEEEKFSQMKNAKRLEEKVKELQKTSNVCYEHITELYNRIIAVNNILIFQKQYFADLINETGNPDTDRVHENRKQLKQYEKEVHAIIDYFTNVVTTLKNEKNDLLQSQKHQRKVEEYAVRLKLEKQLFGVQIFNLNTLITKQKRELENMSYIFTSKIDNNFEELEMLKTKFEELISEKSEPDIDIVNYFQKIIKEKEEKIKELSKDHYARMSEFSVEMIKLSNQTKIQKDSLATLQGITNKQIGKFYEQYEKNVFDMTDLMDKFTEMQKKSLKKINSIKRKLEEKNKAVAYIKDFLKDNIKNIVENYVHDPEFLIDSLKTIFEQVIGPVEQNDSKIQNYEVIFPSVVRTGKLFRAKVVPRGNDSLEA